MKPQKVPTRVDEMIRYLEDHRPFVEMWGAGSLQFDWGPEPGFRAKLTRSDRVGQPQKEPA